MWSSIMRNYQRQWQILVESKLHLSEVFTLATNKLEERQGLLGELKMEGVCWSEALGTCIYELCAWALTVALILWDGAREQTSEVS